MAAITPRRARLGARLRALRADAYPSGLQFSYATGWPQSRVSKLERGAQLPTREDLETWLQVTGHDPDLIAELLDQRAAAKVDYTPDDAVLAAGGFVVRQERRGHAESATTRVVEYQPAMLPGLVQTPAYARELLTDTIGGLVDVAGAEDQVEGLVAERARRQQLLYEPGREITILLDEAALYHRPGSTETMRAQLDRLLTLADLSTVEIGVVPFERPMRVLPLSNFSIHDGTAVLVETLTGEQQHTEPDEVATYSKALEVLRGSAAWGAEAAEMIRRASRWHEGPAN